MGAIKETAPTQVTVIVENVIEYFGDLTLENLEEVIANIQEDNNIVMNLTFYSIREEPYGTDKASLEKIMEDYKEWKAQIWEKHTLK